MCTCPNPSPCSSPTWSQLLKRWGRRCLLCGLVVVAAKSPGNPSTVNSADLGTFAAETVVSFATGSTSYTTEVADMIRLGDTLSFEPDDD